MRLPRLRGALAVGAAGALAAAAWDRTRPARGAVIATRLYAPEAAAAAQRSPVFDQDPAGNGGPP